MNCYLVIARSYRQLLSARNQYYSAQKRQLFRDLICSCGGLPTARGGLSNVDRRGIWIQVLLDLPSELLYQNRNGPGIAFSVVDDSSVDSPINSGNWTGRQPFLQRSSFSNQREAVSFLDQCLHFGRMRSARILFDRDSGIGQQFQQSLVSIGMPFS